MATFARNPSSRTTRCIRRSGDAIAVVRVGRCRLIPVTAQAPAARPAKAPAAKSEAVDDAAHARRPSRPPGHLEQRHDHAARTPDGASLVLSKDEVARLEKGLADRVEAARRAERSEPAGAAEGRRWIDRRGGQRRRLQQFLARTRRSRRHRQWRVEKLAHRGSARRQGARR